MAKSLGLALGSGGARGWAHIGVIKALTEAEIPINYVAGTSIGAFVGGAYVAGRIRELESFVRQLDWKMVLSYFDLVFPNQGLLDGNKIYDLLYSQIQDLKIEDAPIPFCCVATDLISGQELRLRSGLVADAIRASISMPGVFTPFKQNSTYLGDGGIVNPVPVNVVREMGADVILAVNLNHNYGTEIPVEMAEPDEPDNSDLIAAMGEQYNLLTQKVAAKLEQWLPQENSDLNIFDIIGTTINIMEQRVTSLNLELDPPDLLIEPNLCGYGIFDFDKATEIIGEGYRKTQSLLPKLQELLAT